MAVKNVLLDHEDVLLVVNKLMRNFEGLLLGSNFLNVTSLCPKHGTQHVESLSMK